MSIVGIRGLIISILYVALLGASPAQGDELSVYEALSDVTIGRVFLSADQRARLDGRRGAAHKDGSEPARVEGRVRKFDPNSAGYIISGSGRARVWSNGDFVVTDNQGHVTFPGDVKITRKVVSGQEADPDSGTTDDGV